MVRCAVCKYRHKEVCVHGFWFGVIFPEDDRSFKKLVDAWGLNGVKRQLLSVEAHERPDLIRSLVFEVDHRLRDRVRGVHGYVQQLEQQLGQLQLGPHPEPPDGEVEEEAEPTVPEVAEEVAAVTGDELRPFNNPEPEPEEGEAEEKPEAEPEVAEEVAAVTGDELQPFNNLEPEAEEGEPEVAEEVAAVTGDELQPFNNPKPEAEEGEPTVTQVAEEVAAVTGDELQPFNNPEAEAEEGEPEAEKGEATEHPPPYLMPKHSQQGC
nr:lob domain-containing protein 12 [Quercus suber]